MIFEKSAKTTLKKTRKTLFFISCFLFFVTSLHAQKLKQLIADGDKAFADNNFFSAALYYNQAILQDSTDIVMQYKYAEASRLNFDYAIADHWYGKVYKKDAQGKLYPECSFWIASIRKTQGKYKDAKKLFDKYAKKNKKKKDSYFVKKAIQEVAACDYAQLLMASPDKSVSIVHLDSTVNSKVSEYAPIQVDSLLYFSSLRDKKDTDKKNKVSYNKIYTAVQDNQPDGQLGLKWEKANELDTLFNRSGIHNANTSFNEDFTKVFITRCVQKNALEFNCEIYSSDFKNGHWESLKKLSSEINQKGSTNTQPAIGFLGDEEVLFFASNRPGGEGKMDIWYSKINKDGGYDKAINAGKKVNSVDDEITPFYCKPCQELFFSSTWHKGLGGFDIFKSAYKDNELGEPKNLGLPFNSNLNDIYFSINSKKTEAFISSNRIGSFFEEKESCCNDIYMVKLPKVDEPVKKVDSTKIFVTQMKLLVPLTLYFHNDEPDKKTLAITTTKNYKKTYEDYSAMRDLYKKEYSKGAQDKDLERAIGDIDNLFDDSVDAGMQDLEKFAQLLKKVLLDSEKVTITMKGFCSPLASTDYNVNLAKRRISSLRNYFMEYENGVFVKYVNNPNKDEGSITFFDEDIGELKARPNVSDDYYDTKNSIYNPVAALERKIQIVAISTFSSNK
jgi:tetratricopeptide (TPR) repeat protein